MSTDPTASLTFNKNQVHSFNVSPYTTPYANGYRSLFASITFADSSVLLYGPVKWHPSMNNKGRIHSEILSTRTHTQQIDSQTFYLWSIPKLPLCWGLSPVSYDKTMESAYMTLQHLHAALQLISPCISKLAYMSNLFHVHLRTHHGVH
ncbi:hypothetical protein NMG60_11028835 [Bertholletia excelsa]